MEYDFVGGDFDWSIAPNRPKSPVFAPAALRGTRFGLESRAVGRKIFAKSGSLWSTPSDYYCEYLYHFFLRERVREKVTTDLAQLPASPGHLPACEVAACFPRLTTTITILLSQLSSVYL